MTFNFRLLFVVLYKSFFKQNNSPTRLTLKRFISLFLFLSGYFVVESINWTGFALDSIFFRKYKKVQVKNPVFITGNPRSGTTFLHRLMAKDHDTFTSMKYWEIIFAPSVTQKLFWKTVDKADQKIGSPLTKCVLKLEEMIFARYNTMHKTSLFEYDEDELVLIHIFSSLWLVFLFPFENDFMPFVRFDKELPEKQRLSIMKFYKRCVQCHLYAFGKGKRFLSKNPSFCPKIDSLGITFSGAKIIYLVRSPLEAVPSCFSMATFLYNLYNPHVDYYPMHSFTFNLLSWWYSYPIQQLGTGDSDSCKIIKYNNLVKNPEQKVLDIYNSFGFNLSLQFQKTLKKESISAARFKSSHKYSDTQSALSRKQIVASFSNIFARFGFNTEDTNI